MEMVKPRHKKLSILGLGLSVGTNGKTIEAPIIVVRDLAELERRSAEVKGKIVVFNYSFKVYHDARVYRMYGASYAAKYGAVAVFVRSATNLSIYSPHTGSNSKSHIQLFCFDSISHFIFIACTFSQNTIHQSAVSEFQQSASPSKTRTFFNGWPIEKVC